VNKIKENNMLTNDKTEILDIIDENDNVIGTATREQCHTDPKLLHHTVHFTFLDRKNSKVLLTQRSFKKKHDGGKYCFLGEHIVAGESYIEALIRGCVEEANYKAKAFKELAHRIVSYQKESEFVKFFVIDFDGSNLEFAKDEVEQYLWIDIKDLKNIKLDISEMTKYWIDNIDWDKV